MPKSNLHFMLMSLTFRVRDILVPPMRILDEVGIKPGFHVLDYGCGPGSYLAPLAELVGEAGKVYALDIHPLAVERARRIASVRGLKNVEAILSGGKTGLPDRSVDVVLLYDTFHELSDPDGVLEELHRILKPDGILSFSDHHLREEQVVSKVTGGGLFELLRKHTKTYSFSKVCGR